MKGLNLWPKHLAQKQSFLNLSSTLGLIFFPILILSLSESVFNGDTNSFATISFFSPHHFHRWLISWIITAVITFSFTGVVEQLILYCMVRLLSWLYIEQYCRVFTSKFSYSDLCLKWYEILIEYIQLACHIVRQDTSLFLELLG